MYLDTNNLYGWAMSQKLPVNGFKWVNGLSRFNEDFIENHNENSDVGYFLEIDKEHPKKLFSSHKELPFLPERRKLEKVEKLVCSIEDKEKYVIHMRALKKSLNNGLILKDVNKVIQFNQEAWLKLYIDMNTKLGKEAKNEFEKDFFKLMNNSVFGKTMKNVRKHRDIKLVTTDEKRNKLVSEPNYHTTKRFSENLLAIEMKKTKVKMNKPIYLGMSILDISKTLMYEFCMITFNQSTKTKQNYATWILIALLLIFLLKTFLKTLTMMLKDGLIHLTMIRMIKDHFK